MKIMNTRIARRLNEAGKHEGKELNVTARDIVEAHNQASRNGLIDLPTLNYCNVTSENNGTITVAVTPKCGMININDLYNLKTAWGADNLDVCSESGMTVLLTFKR